MEQRRKNLTQLFIPICLETLLYMLSGMVDTLMLSSVNDQAVGAVGTANTYIGIFIIMFSVISSGMVAVMTQNIGAGRPGVAYQARQLGLAFNAVLGVIMSLFLSLGAGTILSGVGVADALMQPAKTYLQIVGGFCILNALIPICSSYLRAFGFSKEPLYASIIGNVINFLPECIFPVCTAQRGGGCCYRYGDLTHHQSGDCCTAWCCFGESKTASGEREQPGSDGTDHPYRASICM